MTARMEAHRHWYPALVQALHRVEQVDNMKGVFQLATYDHPSRTPRVRSHILRSFVTPTKHPSLPLLVSTTDIRTPKVTQVTDANNVEAVFWTEPTLEQFRISGTHLSRLLVVVCRILSRYTDEEEKRNVERALENFALVIIEPLGVDFVELGTRPEKRTMYRRNLRETEFTATIVVP
ncbi:pyridoxamine 5'-phosphate oxidase-domain-containing protein [Pisolithus tinctorius]|nr:pyridoxamine 5'-phosphate oxidase-domain-containing protein [Pisolithus tinctorius]